MEKFEAQLAHLERTIDDLSDVIARQDKEIETLKRRVQLLMERGYSREQAYVICSVAVDLRISNAVDLPTVCTRQR